ncbi:MAG TPA: DNA polymerase III subunit delta [Clostridiales bacterium]|jgi:DNA polymerase-3 subunit delta|nr:DNA polymerase III subunit delta [Clostridiales bacterium]
MKIIKEHIKSGRFKQFYLLYGSESYLIKLYRDKLREAVSGESDQMNFSRFEGKGIDLKELNDVAQTLPFFGDKRLILIEQSGLFKEQSELPNILADAPESTMFIFAEQDVDRRNKAYKLINDRGVVSEMKGLDDKNLRLFVASLLKQAGKNITRNVCDYLLDKTGTDMDNISNEVEKLIGYTLGRDIITVEDVDAVVTTQITGKIFQMMDAIGSKQQGRALTLYYDLLSVREKPSHILYLIMRHFNVLLQVKEMVSFGYASELIIEHVGIPAFTIGKYISQTKNFTIEQLYESLKIAADTEEQIKKGQINDKIGVELMIIRFSR